MSPSVQQAIVKRAKPLLFVACLIPFALLIFRGLTGRLGAEPIDEISVMTGQWTLRFLLITLSVTPLRWMTGWNALLRLRRMLGLFAFFYALLHFLTYVVLDQFFAWHFIVEDIVKRPYILLGFTALMLLIPLAVTSTNRMVKRLGARRWQRLHRLVYVIAVLGVFHFFLLVKADVSQPVLYGLILAGLLGYRWRRASQGSANMSPAWGSRRPGALP